MRETAVAAFLVLFPSVAAYAGGETRAVEAPINDRAPVGPALSAPTYGATVAPEVRTYGGGALDAVSGVPGTPQSAGIAPEVQRPGAAIDASRVQPGASISGAMERPGQNPEMPLRDAVSGTAAGAPAQVKAAHGWTTPQSAGSIPQAPGASSAPQARDLDNAAKEIGQAQKLGDDLVTGATLKRLFDHDRTGAAGHILHRQGGGLRRRGVGGGERQAQQRHGTESEATHERFSFS
jgi:hypothetical protein